MKNNSHEKTSPELLEITKTNIIKAGIAINKAELVVFPTETVYGLGADATNDQAVAKIFTAKCRPRFNPLIVHVFSHQMAKNLVKFCSRANKLAKAFWPGPLTLVLPKRSDCPISLMVSAGLDSLAIRVPNHPVALQLLRTAKVPVAAPSANLSGAVSPTIHTHTLDSWSQIGKMAPNYILSGGQCSVGIESTVVDLLTDKASILRPGGITKSQIMSEIGSLQDEKITHFAPRSPGMLSKHYATKTPLILNAEGPKPKGVFISFGNSTRYQKYNLSKSGCLNEAASNLFALLHEVDKQNYSSISIAPIPRQGLGIAINDRLERAAKE